MLICVACRNQGGTAIFGVKGGIDMFCENLKLLRKQKGMSQEALAQQLNVVRQTISKWEKGLSVPDAELLTRIAELFEVSVSELLGTRIEEEKNINEIAAQLALLNEQLAYKNNRTKKLLKYAFIGILGAIVVVTAVKWAAFFAYSYQIETEETTTVEISSIES